MKEEAPSLSVHGHSVKVAEVLQDGDGLTFLIVSQKVRRITFTVHQKWLECEAIVSDCFKTY